MNAKGGPRNHVTSKDRFAIIKGYLCKKTIISQNVSSEA